MYNFLVLELNRQPASQSASQPASQPAIQPASQPNSYLFSPALFSALQSCCPASSCLVKRETQNPEHEQTGEVGGVSRNTTTEIQKYHSILSADQLGLSGCVTHEKVEKRNYNCVTRFSFYCFDQLNCSRPIFSTYFHIAQH